jgi:endonuclease YncB( thermonuclease family)
MDKTGKQVRVKEGSGYAMKKTLLASGVLACLLASPLIYTLPAFAQEMPAPRRMPRIAVDRQTLEERRSSGPRIVEGSATIFDGDKLRVGDTDLRLFGAVPPQLGASFGPQARATLDALANGQNVTCQVRDRDHDWRLLATCRTASGADMALELLRRGLAVSARGSLTNSDLAPAYLAAERAAQSQRLGLWSVLPPAPAATSSVAAPGVDAALQIAETAAAAPATPPAASHETAAPRSDKIASAKSERADALTPPPSEAQTKIFADLADPQTEAPVMASMPSNEMGFFERYQILIASALMLTTALSIITALWAQKTRDKRDEARAVAAALRGELMAARGVCAGRIKAITNEAEDHAAIWPRIRSTLYQAYVGRLGLLGAELARQVASIYGQSSDYASLYSPSGVAYDASKKQALESLARHIDEVLPKLAGIESTGATPALLYRQRPRSRYDAPPSALLQSPAPQALRSAYKTIDGTAQAKPNPPTQTAAKPAAQPAAMEEEPAVRHAQQPVRESITPTALWETVRGFIQNHRNAIADGPPEEEVSEYAALIEADMARFPYNDTLESFDISPHKRRG